MDQELQSEDFGAKGLWRPKVVTTGVQAPGEKKYEAVRNEVMSASERDMCTVHTWLHGKQSQWQIKLFNKE